MYEKYMLAALAEAELCSLSGDVPVGCVIVKGGRVIGRGHNTREAQGNALGHAEITAIDMACHTLGGWRLTDCQLYVTLEPCPMCAGAIINARIGQVFFGAFDKKGGAVGGVIDLFAERFNHKPQVIGGIMEAECRKVLEDFFLNLKR